MHHIRQKGRGRVQRMAREMFGYEQLRPGQEAATRALLDGHDTLAVMPTGSGKSFIYQVAATLMSGPTVVVSPLIALQQDQVEQIEEQEVGRAALVNSTLRAAEWREVFNALKEGQLEFLFLAPEQFNNEETLQQVKEAEPSLFVVDEAHCISEWGHDFRPDYLRLSTVIEELGHPRVLALTATASPPVREEILERLYMHDPQVIVRGFDRPNIWFGVETFRDESTKKQALVERVVEADKPGIVYTATRKHAREIARLLSEASVTASFYHAGMRASDREQVQNAFMDDEIEVIVATNAFGMGIDKANVRFVFHYDVSDSIDSYKKRHEPRRRVNSRNVQHGRTSMPEKKNTLLNPLTMIAAGAGLLLLSKQVWQPRLKLAGLVVLITGGSRGLGLAMAEEFARHGARVAICARDERELERARAILSEIGTECAALPCDLTQRDQVLGMVKQVITRFGRIDILVNNAGIISAGPLQTLTVEDFEMSMDNIYWATFNTTMAVLPQMLERKNGRIVNISSIGGLVSVPHLLTYASAKFAVEGFSEGLRAELAKEGIKVTTVAPGLLRTGSHVNTIMKGDKHREEYTWFTLLDTLPFTSISARRAARQIVAATRRGNAELVISIQAQLLARFHGLFPGLTADIMGLVNRFLPAGEGAGTTAHTGSESETPITQSFLTTLGQRAVRTYNENGH